MMLHSRSTSFSFFHRETGLFHGSYFRTNCDDEAGCAAVVKLNTPPDHVAIEGYHDPLSNRVDMTTNTVVDYQPPQPSPEHQWDGTTKRWVLCAAAVERQNATRTAQARLVELDKLERPLLRRLVLDQTDTEARAALTAIDTEIAELKTIATG